MAIKRSGFISKLAGITSKKIAYKISDRLIAKKMTSGWKDENKERISHFEKEKPVLNDVQSKLLADINAKGFAAIDVRELISDKKLIENLEKDVNDWSSSPEIKKAIASYNASLEAGNDAIEASNTKPYELKRNAQMGSKVPKDSPLVQFAINKEVLDIVNSYFGLNALAYHVDEWHTLANHGKTTRNASQKWHRDPEDTRLVKIFLYMKDIPKSAGPFEYVLHSKNGAKYDKVAPQQPPYGSVLTDEEVKAKINADEVIMASYPKYTILFVDTTGIHRGGYAIDEDRLLCHWIYTSSVCPYPRYIDVEKMDRSQLSQAQIDAIFE